MSAQRRAVLAVAGALALMTVGWSPAAAKPGDAIVVDFGTGLEEAGTVSRLDLDDGGTSFVTTNLLSAQASTPGLLRPGGLVVAADGVVYALDPYGLLGAPAIFRVDPRTGGQTVFSANGISARRGGVRGLRFPTSMAAAPDGDLLVTDYARRGSVVRVDSRTRRHRVIASRLSYRTERGRVGLQFPASLTLDRPDRVAVLADARSGASAILRVSLRTGRRKLIAVGGRSLPTSPITIAAAGDGSLLVGGEGGVERVNAEGRATEVSSNERSKRAGGGEHFLDEVTGLAVDGSGTVIASTSSRYGTPEDDAPGSVVLIDPATGRQSLLTSNSKSAQNGGRELLLAPTSLAVDPTGDVLVADRATLGEFGPGLVVRVDRAAGTQTALTSSAINGIDPGDQALSTPTGAAFERRGTLLVSERFGPDEGSDDGVLVRVDPASGRQRTVASRAIARRIGGPNLLNSPRGVALARDGSAVVVNAGSYNFTRLHVIRVDPRTGRQSLIATNARSRRAGTPALFLEPAGWPSARGGQYSWLTWPPSVVLAE